MKYRFIDTRKKQIAIGSRCRYVRSKFWGWTRKNGATDRLNLIVMRCEMHHGHTDIGVAHVQDVAEIYVMSLRYIVDEGDGKL